jgi:hypothetical protein
MAIVTDWNERTADHRRALEKHMAGLIDRRPGAPVQLTRDRAVAIYESEYGGAGGANDLWDVRFHLFELLNYFEVVAIAYRHSTADRLIIDDAFKQTLSRWFDVLNDFITIVEDRRGYCPWQPYVDLVNEWRQPAGRRPPTGALLRRRLRADFRHT